MSVHGSAALSAVAQHLTETELACKRTGAPAEMLVRATILTVARRAAATAQRR
jgi:hypothetical protein